jgi:hypothetical protein
MSKVITFSRVFPSYHPKKGQPTYFPEKIITSLDIEEYRKMTLMDFLSEEFDPTEEEFIKGSCNPLFHHIPKYHTIRAGQRWKEGDWFSPRVWSGKPYNSPQIIIAEDIQIKKALDIEITLVQDYLTIGIEDDLFYEENSRFAIQKDSLELLSKNDGLSSQDLKDWFLLSPNFKKKSSFVGQIICWNDQINY